MVRYLINQVEGNGQSARLATCKNFLLCRLFFLPHQPNVIGLLMFMIYGSVRRHREEFLGARLVYLLVPGPLQRRTGDTGR